MAEKITTRENDFSQWYVDVVLQARMADYSPVKGCMVIRPNGYAVWENIQRNLDRMIKETGHQNAYFPIFIPESFLKKEADHVEGFAPQCAVVTYAGAKDLEEKLVVRPTSETIINSMFAKWIQSYRDLPLLINQWANVVRWEMRTRLFLRTTEFLWQEGHTCHETPEEAEVETLKMLRVYKDFAENYMAMPVIAGLKTPSEKFAGAERTYCIEAMLQDRKALQAGTSHNLGQNFAKAFETKFQDRTANWQFVHQTSWGVSTRLIGGIVMTHSDDKGLVLPPKLAGLHVAIVPISKNPAADKALFDVADKLAYELKNPEFTGTLGYTITSKVDRDDQHSPGWKFHEYELTGIPIRVELGARDLEKNQVTIVRRDTGVKQFIPIADAAKTIARELGQMQTDLLERAREIRKKFSFVVDDYEDFKKKLDEPGGFLHAHWCEQGACEAKIKEETKATIRCIPLDAADRLTPSVEEGKCIRCNGKSMTRVIFARSY
ncbi:MAG: proline--tRNA ligase [Deltaproteobacteria bacterium]|nr:proline--tRNA ligase [Deltaproteobacteria bacterium]